MKIPKLILLFIILWHLGNVCACAQISEAATDMLVNEALEKGQPVRDLCAARFKDYQFGLKLIAQNSGQTEFMIDEESVRNADKTLSEWVVASYRKEEQIAGG